MKPTATVKETGWEGRYTIYAEHQPQYISLPVFQHYGLEGRVVSTWKLSWRERVRVMCHGKVKLEALTFNSPLQPVRPSIP